MMYTNNVPCGSYRAPGEPQAVFAVESHTDMIARAMGIDPYVFRLQNVVQEGDVSGTGQVFRHVRGEAAIPAARIKVLCNPIISSVRQPVGCLYPAFETLF
jgi:CO/xanthine dehydrogenase Mo-binding subunit